MWTAVSVMSIILLGRMYRKMRGGSLPERARQEAYAHGMRMGAEEMKRNAEAGRRTNGAGH